METKKYPIIVEQFHFDMVDPKTDTNQNVQVAMRQVEPSDPARKDELKSGNMFEIMVPFDVIPPQAGFRVSGKITRVVQTLDYFGQANEISPDDLEKLSRPLIEYIETLTYQVTAVALDKGYQLEFEASGNQKDNQ
ncbi:hypothetical protein IV38_GL001458 [Lactobacillus selangorensis]|uniref:DUF1149 family protein n=1 Tax=Lactobacillus selangorensis TaxID=81857 RepID=A0A0R2FX31_9LACO|nr:DUF1149 family protein [Lactobacillus selangorensis]KRN28457.1 hypothetical protein IV38_GL001458 [Lactobacillus selangorensis]KRN31958.1 hypothetical protein IV40_GL001245 [Lactobacillus selangorensis]